ncbi:MAG: hypothetical protein ACK44B_10690 [Flavobacteriales bacterium]
MIQKINNSILITLIGSFLYSAYKLLINNEIFPYGILLFFTLICIGMYLSLLMLRKISAKFYLLLSIVSIINSTALLLYYYYPHILRNTWNYSFATALLIIFASFIVQLRTLNNNLAKVTLAATVISLGMLETILIGKITDTTIHSLAFWSFVAVSLLMVTTFASQLKR